MTARDAALGHAGASPSGGGPGAPPVVRIDELVLAPATLTVLGGATGSGKTTVLRALSGLHTHVDGGTLAGTLEVVGHDRAAVPPRDTAQRVGVVLQHPREAFATEHVRDEVGLALELRGVARVIVAARVDEVAEAVGIRHLLDRRLRGLSAGEATLVAIAAAVVERPILLVVDEPLADLDESYRRRIVDLLGTLAHEAGVCVVVAEHRVAEFADVADRFVAIEDGGLHEAAPTVGASSVGLQLAPAPGATPDAPAAPVLSVRGLTVRHGTATAVADASFDLRAGEIVALVGPNGAGKSSLLAAIAVPDAAADVAVDGDRVPRRAPGIALVPDASDDLFVCDSVAAECRRADRRARAQAGSTARRFCAFLGLEPDDPAAAERLARHPLDLSAGERRCLAFAVQLASAPRALLVDEPTRGLDPRARELVAATLARLAAEGAAVLVATHDSQFAAAVAGAILPLRDGRLGERVGVVRALSSSAAAAAEDGAAREARPDGEIRSSHAASDGSELDTAVGPAADGAASTVAAGGDDSIRSPDEGSRHAPEADAGAVSAATGAPRAGLPAKHPSRATLALVAANIIAFAAFCWPLAAMAVPAQAQAAVPFAAFALAPLAVLVVLASLDGTVRSAHTLALLGILAAIGAAIRIVGTGVGGVEAVFVLLILAGRVFGARFGLLLGVLTIALSSLLWGGIGPWTPFQMFACAWVGAGAGLLPRRSRRPLRTPLTPRPEPPGAWARPRTAEIGMLIVYGIVASYAFGLVMNLWFWPFAVGTQTGISYEAGAPVGQNLSSFLLYSLVTSTLTWDTLRAVTTTIGLLVVGRAVLASLRRAKPVAPLATPLPRPTSSRSQAHLKWASTRSP